MAASKYLFDIRSTISLSFSLQHSGSDQIQNDELIPSTTTTKGAVLKFDSRINEAIDISYKGEARSTKSVSDNGASSTLIGQYHQKGSANFTILEKVTVNVTDDNYLIRPAGELTSVYNFLDCTGHIRLVRPKVTASCGIMNIFDNKTYKTLYLAGNTYSTTTYTIPGRYLLFTLNFNL
jgi:hypothetical protein